MTGLENIHEVKGHFGEPIVVVRDVFLEDFSAGGAGVFVGAGVDVADADFGFEVPMAVEHPVVAVGNAGTDAPALIAIVMQKRVVRAEKLKIEINIANVKLAAEKMCSDKVAGESFAKPIAGFGLNEPMLPFVFVNGPGIDVA